MTNLEEKTQPKYLFVFLSIALIVALFVSAILVIKQINQYRGSFSYSNKLTNQKNQINTEWHRLLLEQQTFGATTKVESRALVTMGMYSPKPNEVVTINSDSLNFKTSEKK